MKKIITNALFSQKDSSKSLKPKSAEDKSSTSTDGRGVIDQAQSMAPTHTKIDIHMEKSIDTPIIVDRSHLIDQPFSFSDKGWNDFINALQNGKKEIVLKNAVSQKLGYTQEELFTLQFKMLEDSYEFSALMDVEEIAKAISAQIEALSPSDQEKAQPQIDLMKAELDKMDKRRWSFTINEDQWKELLSFYRISLEKPMSMDDIFDDF